MLSLNKLLLVAVLCGCAAQSQAANILLLTMGNASHFLEIDGIGRPLLARGHQVYVMLDNHTTMPKTAQYKLITYDVPDDTTIHMDSKSRQKFVTNSREGMNMTFVFEILRKMCIGMMSDQELFPKLQSLKIDLVILDNGPVPCFFLIPYKLGVPFVTVSTVLYSWSVRVPLLPSVVQPVIGLEAFGLHFCEETEQQWGIVRRICRLISLLMPEVFFTNFDTEYIREYADFPTIQEIRENVSFTLVNSAHYLSTPLPKLPNVEYVGGLTTRPPKPLDDSLEKWMSQAANVVIVSFGSMFDSLPSAITKKLFEAFTQLPQYRFLFRHKHEELDGIEVPVNVRLMDWLPQNDALGHNSTIAFVTHSGNNGQQEALYHGVPMLCFFVQADQKVNAKRVVQRGFGKMIDIHDFTVEQLVTELSELIHNPSFAQRIKKASRIFHSEKHPSERAADAVEHVLKYGSEHLKPKEALKLSWWQFYMLDVFAIVYLVLVAAVVVLVKALKCALRCLLRRNSGSNRKPKTD